MKATASTVGDLAQQATSEVKHTVQARATTTKQSGQTSATTPDAGVEEPMNLVDHMDPDAGQ
jgi:hypothetical protein